MPSPVVSQKPRFARTTRGLANDDDPRIQTPFQSRRFLAPQTATDRLVVVSKSA
jgi:hypothetical protein